MMARDIAYNLFLGVLLSALLILSACRGDGPSSVTVTISGQVQYEDKLYNEDGFTGTTTYRPVRFADVDVVDLYSSDVLASGMTDTNGYYSLTSALSVTTVYVRVVSSAIPSGLASSTVQVRSLSNSLFGVPGSSFVASDNPAANISIPATNSAAGAFNILDVYTSAYQFINSLGKNPPSLNVFWQMGNQRGTYFCTSYDPTYCPNSGGIYVLGGSNSSGAGDTDHYDDDVLWHEFGHFAGDAFSKDESPGGPHNLGANDQDMRLSWSEGWGDFFPGAVKSWMSSTDLSATGMPESWYVDTEDNTTLISWDFGALIGPNYSSSETAVANVLLQLRNVFGMQPIWDVVTSAAFTTATPVNLETFWDAWVSSGEIISEPVPSIYGSRSIYYRQDNFEIDSLIASASTYTGAPQNHTLYGTGDIDYVLFSASSGSLYTITTSTLTNGADTYLRVLDAAGNEATLPNDNYNGASYSSSCTICPPNNAYALSSLISFPCTTTGTYSVEIKSSPNRPKSAGKYGSYTLSITSP